MRPDRNNLVDPVILSKSFLLFSAFSAPSAVKTAFYFNTPRIGLPPWEMCVGLFVWSGTVSSGSTPIR